MSSLIKNAVTVTVALLLGASLVEAQQTTPATTTTTALSSSSSTACATVLTPSYSPPVAASGWKAQLVATGLNRPRGIKFDSNGGLLVVEAGVGLTRLTLTDNGGTCLSVKSNTSVITDKALNHGLELSEDGKTLYVSSAENVYRYSYDPDTATVGNQTTLVTGMSHANGGGHTTRTLLLSKKQPDLLLVSRGSASNIDPSAAQQSSGVSQIRAFNISNPTAPYDYASDGLLVGWGLRNSVGVAEHPSTGTIFSVENSADNVAINNIDIHEDNPGEELNSHGTLPHPAGSNHGYPNCFALWDTALPSALTPLFPNPTIGIQFPLFATTSTSVNTTCGSGNYTPPRLTFQAHTAPLDIKFLPLTNTTTNTTTANTTEEALITFHGSWNRDHAAGYKLSSVSFSPSTGEPVAQAGSSDGARDVLSAPDVGACAEAGACMRPVGVAVQNGEGGRVFVSSDATGEVWVLVKSAEGGGGSSSAAEGRSGVGRLGWVVAAVMVAVVGL